MQKMQMSNQSRPWTFSLLQRSALGFVLTFAATSGATELPDMMRRWENPQTPVSVKSPAELSGPSLLAAAEASPDRMRLVRTEYMNSSQISAYLRSGGDIAILPLGGMEMRALDGLLGTRTIITHATAILLAERWGALVFPPIRYTSADEGRRWAGTVSIPIDETISYVRAVINCLLDGGFKRVVLLSTDRSFRLHGQFLMCSIHRQRGALPIYCEIDLLPDTEQISKQLNCEPTDNIRVMAGLNILGHPGVFNSPKLQTNYVPPPNEFERIRSRAQEAHIGIPPVSGDPPGQIAAPQGTRQIDIGKVIAIMRRQAKKFDRFPAEFTRYQKEVASQLEAKPWSTENYTKSMELAWSEAKSKPASRKTKPDQPAVELPEKLNSDYIIPLSSLPPEAYPAYKRQVRGEFMSAAQLVGKFKRGEDLVILPVGAFEMHGPHGLLDTDTIQAHCRAIMLAGGWKAVVAPPIHYVHTGATEFWPGTISPSHADTISYVTAVAEAWLDAGFKRVVILWFHYPGRLMSQQIARDIYRRQGKVVFPFFSIVGATMSPPDEMEKHLGYRYGEDIGALTGVKVLGHPGVFVVDEPVDVPGIWDIQAGWNLQKMGAKGRAWYMRLPTQHLWVRSCVKSGDEDKLIDIMRETAKRYADVPRIMNEYLDGLRDLEAQAPWNWENWKLAPKAAQE